MAEAVEHSCKILNCSRAAVVELQVQVIEASQRLGKLALPFYAKPRLSVRGHVIRTQRHGLAQRLLGFDESRVLKIPAAEKIERFVQTRIQRTACSRATIASFRSATCVQAKAETELGVPVRAGSRSMARR